MPPHLRRVAHILTSLSLGGAEKIALMLASRQLAQGLEVHVVSFEETPRGVLERQFERAGIRVQRTPKRPGFDLTLPPRLTAFFLRKRIDVVHTHNPLPLIYAAPAAKLAGARVVHTKHGPHPDKRRRLLLRRIAAASCDAFVAVSDATASFARTLGEVSPSKLTVIANGTDLHRFAHVPGRREETRRAWGVEEDVWVVGTVGRLAKVKDHALLLRAIAPLLGPKCILMIAGEGSEAEATEALSRQLGIAQHVRMLGMVDNVAGVLAGLDAFVLSSQTEGLPVAVTEAMAAGLPVVATAVGGVPKVVEEGETGLLVPYPDEEALRQAIAKLSNDRGAAERFGARGREVAHQRFSGDRMAQQYMDLYLGQA